MKLNVQKFSFPEMFNDANGKTCAVTTASLFVIATGCLGFILSGSLSLWFTVVSKAPMELTTLTNQSVMLVTIGTSMLITKRVTTDQKVTLPEEPKI